MKARVGILTMHRVVNYGSALQAYATQHIVESMGYDSEIIDYEYPNVFQYERGEMPPRYGWKSRLAKAFGLSARWRKANKFETFRKEHLIMSGYYASPDGIKAAPPRYDIYMTGSDQVWNPTCGGLVDKLNPCYYLAFAHSNQYKKVAYASSLGSYRFNEEERVHVKKWLDDYHHLSTRELAGAEHLKEILGKDVKVVLDPTLLLDSEQWREVSRPTRVKGKYVLVYYIDEIAECVEYAREVADKNEWKVVMMSNTSSRFPGVDQNIPFCGPAQFLWLFDHAEYVVTNSFHGTAFAVNFNRPFISVIKRNSPQRAQTLLASVGLPERLLTDIAQVAELPNEIDWNTANIKLETLRKDSTKYLINAIEN